jgi:hypothetical protein
MLRQIEKCVDLLEEHVDEHPELMADLIEAQEYFTYLHKEHRHMTEGGDMFVYAD